MGWLITIYSICLLLLILSAIGFIMFYVFSLMTHKDDPVYPGKKVIQGLIVFSLTWIFFMVFMPLNDIIYKYDLQDSFLGFDLDLDDFYYAAIEISIVLCALNIIASKYYQIQETNVNKRILKALKESSYHIGGYIISVILVYFGCGKLTYNRNVHLVTPRVFIMSYQVQSFVPKTTNLKQRVFFDLQFEIAFLTPFVILSMFYFSIYGAASLAIFPLESIKNLILAPSRYEPDFQVYSKQNLIRNGEELIEEGKRIYSIQRELDLGIVSNPREKSKRQKALKKDIVLYKKRLFQYEEICEYFREQENLDKQNPIKQKVHLVAMFVGLAISISIFLQHFIMLADNFFLLDDFFANMEKKQPLLPHIVFMMFVVYLVIAIAYSLKTISVYLPFKDDFFPFMYKKTYDDTFLESLPIFIMSVFGFQLFIPVACDTYYSYSEVSFLTLQVLLKVVYFKKVTDSGFFLYIFVLVFVMSMFITFFIVPARKKLEEMNYFLEKKEKQKKALTEQGQLIQLLKDPLFNSIKLSIFNANLFICSFM